MTTCQDSTFQRLAELGLICSKLFVVVVKGIPDETILLGASPGFPLIDLEVSGAQNSFNSFIKKDYFPVDNPVWECIP